jgi:hypothetical protein
MTVKARLDSFERQLKAATIALSKQGRLPVRLVFVNDPEEGLDEYRLPPEVLALNQTIEIGSLAQPDAIEDARNVTRP